MVQPEPKRPRGRPKKDYDDHKDFQKVDYKVDGRGRDPLLNMFLFSGCCFFEVVSKTSHVKMVPSRSMLYSVGRYDEDTATYGDHGTITALGLLEQINVTRDTSDYLWYIIRENKKI
ncbi:hypothetical protein Bca4012_063100 [Brassica carinata]